MEEVPINDTNLFGTLSKIDELIKSQKESIDRISQIMSIVTVLTAIVTAAINAMVLTEH